MPHSSRRRALVVVAIMAVLALTGALAYAYRSSTGTGSGSATTGTSTAFVVAGSPATGGPLSPGGPTQTVAFTVTDPGGGAQFLATVAVTVDDADGTPWTVVAGCSAADHTVGTPTITMNNLPSNQDGCQNATVPLYSVAG